MIKLRCTATVVAAKQRDPYEDRKTGEMVQSTKQNVVVIDPETVETETFQAPLVKDDKPLVFTPGQSYDLTVEARAYDRFSGPVIVWSITDAKPAGAGQVTPPAPAARHLRFRQRPRDVAVGCPVARTHPTFPPVRRPDLRNRG